MAPPLDRMIQRGDLDVQLLESVLSAGPRDIEMGTNVHGAGGFGKTHLATWICQVPEVKARFTGGNLWITVGSEVRGPELAQRINDLSFHLTGDRPSLADPDAAGVELGRRLDLIAKPVLLVIDDVWDETQLRAFRYGGEQCSRVVTTRIPNLFPSANSHIRVDAMTDREAVSLATEGLDDLPTELASQLVQLTGGWPVLLNLVNGALRFRVTHGEPIAAAALHIINRLVIGGPAALDPRRQKARTAAVALTMAASLDLLTLEDRERYLDLAIFPEDRDIPLKMLELLWPGHDAHSLCQDFVQLGLAATYRLDSADPRIRLHDVVRSYVISRREHTQHERVHARLVESMAALCESEGRYPEQPALWWTLPRENRYIWTNLIFHMIQAGRRGEANTLVADLRWAAGSIEACGSSLPFEADLDAVGGEREQAIGQVIRRMSHILAPADIPNAVVSTLACRLAEDPILMELDIRSGPTHTTPHVKNLWPLPDIHATDLIQAIEANIGYVLCVAVSPDGTELVTGGGDGTLRIREIKTGSQRLTLQGHGDSVASCAYTPCGTMIVSASADLTARIWDAATGQTRTVLRGHTRRLTKCAISKDGRLIATTGNDSAVCVWDLESGQMQRKLLGHRNGAHACDFSPDGVLLATAGTDGIARLWNLETGALVREIAAHRKTIWDCSFSPDGKLLATSSTDRSTRLWTVDTGERAGGVRGHSTTHRANSFSPDGSLLATTSNDDTVRLWHMPTGRLHKTLIGHRSAIDSCSFSPDGQSIATASYDGTVRLWKVEEERSYVSSPHGKRSSSIAFSPDGRSLLAMKSGYTQDDQGVDIWTVETGEKLTTVSYGQSFTCAFAPDGLSVATAGHGYIMLWDLTDRSHRTHFAEPNQIYACAFSPNGRLLAYTTEQQTVVILDTKTGRRRSRLEGHTAAVRTCAFSPRGNLLATGGDDAAVTVWDPRTNARLTTLTGHKEPVLWCVFSPDGHHLATASADKTIKIWNTDDWSLTSNLEDHLAEVNSCDFSPDSRVLASVGNDRVLRLWNIDQGRCITGFFLTEPAHGCSWHPQKPYIAVGGLGGIYMFEAILGQEATP